MAITYFEQHSPLYCKMKMKKSNWQIISLTSPQLSNQFEVLQAEAL